MIENNNNNIMTQSNELKIHNMNLISDDLLVNKIKNEGRDYKNGLYFNNYGKYKYTDLGLSYPEYFDKYKKIPDYKGTDYEEKSNLNIELIQQILNIIILILELLMKYLIRIYMIFQVIMEKNNLKEDL